MKALSEPTPLPPDISGPASAVLVALAGAALVAVGLLLVGAREVSVGYDHQEVLSIAER